MDSIIYAYYIEGKHLEMHCLRPCICIALIRIIYGGYVTAKNADAFMAYPNIDGLFMTESA